MRKITFLAAVLSFLFTQAICAAEPNAPDANSFRRTHRMHRSERVVINWHDGIQQMVVSPRIAYDTNSLWIFPVKCESEQVKFSIAKDFPQFYGTDCRQTAGNILDNVNHAIIATQLWTIPLCHFLDDGSDSDYSFIPSSTNVIDSNGVHIELLKADSTPAMAQQLKERGRTIEETELQPYAKYLNKEYSLLAVWREGNESDNLRRSYRRSINDGNEPNAAQSDFRQRYHRRVCLYVEFPSEKPFYPMLWDNSRRGRLSFTLTGFWQIAGQEQPNAFQCSQLVSRNANIPDSFKASLPQNDIPFTIFSMFGESNSLPNDIAFVPGRLKEMAYPDAVSKMSYLKLVLPGLIILAVISYLSAGISGLITYRKWRGFAELGLLNILTIVAMGIAMNYKKGGIYEIFRQSKWKPRLFLAFFSIMVVLLSFALFTILKMPLNLP